MPSLEHHDRPTFSVKAAEPSPPRPQFSSHVRVPDFGCSVRYYVPSLPPIHEELGPESEQHGGLAPVLPVLTRWASAPLVIRAKSQRSSVCFEDVQRSPRLTKWASGPLRTLAQPRRNGVCFEKEQQFPTLTRWTSGPIETLARSLMNSECFEKEQQFPELTNWTSGPPEAPAQSQRNSVSSEGVQRFPGLTRCTSGPLETPSEPLRNSACLQDAQQGRRSSATFPERIHMAYVIAALVAVGVLAVACKITIDMLKYPNVPIDQVGLLAFIGAAFLVVPFVMYIHAHFCRRSSAARPGVSTA